MKRLAILSLILALASVGAIAQTDEPGITYDLAAEIFAEMLTVLNQAIYLVSEAIHGIDQEHYRSDLQDYAQAIINLLEGPESELFDADSPLSILSSIGLIPLMNGMRSWNGQAPASELYGDRAFRYSSEVLAFLEAWKFVDAALQAASDTAQSMIRPPYTFPWRTELSVLYSLLVSARGGQLAEFPLGGAHLLASLFPRREIWVAAGDSIQDAIEQVPDGGTVYIEPGTYRETLVIRKNVSLVAASHAPNGIPGLGSTILQGLLWGGPIEIRTNEPIEVSIQGVVLRDSVVGIGADGDCTVLVQDVTIEDCQIGFYVTSGASITARACQVIRSEQAILAAPGGYCRLEDSVIEGSDPGSFEGAVDIRCAVAELIRCEIRDTQGIAIDAGAGQSSKLHLEECRILRNTVGIVGLTGMCVSAMGDSTPVVYTLPTITGFGNVIPVADDPDGNGTAFQVGGPFDDVDLSFLIESKLGS